MENFLIKLTGEQARHACSRQRVRWGIIKKDISLKNLHFKKRKGKKKREKKVCETYRGTPPQLKSTPGVESLEASNRDTVSVSPSPSRPRTTSHPIQASLLVLDVDIILCTGTYRQDDRSPCNFYPWMHPRRRVEANSLNPQCLAVYARAI